MSTLLFDTASLSHFPAAPGVYLMKDADGRIIYVGKAANLRQRVSSYFNSSGDNRLSVQFLRRHVATIDFVVTSNEKEAFLLENTLIKDHQPRYNIRLRDDKTFVSIRLRMDHRYPRLEVVRLRKGRDQKRKATDLEFGPYTSAASVRETLRVLLRIFPVRTCKDSVFRSRTRPCILYDVGKCCGPCVLPVPDEDYRALIEDVAMFLRGRRDEVRAALRAKMAELSEAMEFERAAAVRDRIAALERTLEPQNTHSLGSANRDVIAVVSEAGRSLIVVQQYRNGLLVSSRDHYLKNYGQSDETLLYQVLQQRYGENEIPAEIVLSTEPDDSELLEAWLSETRGGPCRLLTPQRGHKVRLAELAVENARVLLTRRLSGDNTEDEVLTELQKKLGLATLPRTMECLDISNIMGILAVGAITRSEGTKPDKSGYRLFRIKTVDGANDFAMMEEVLRRRFRPHGNASPDLPDMLLVDGGKGQLGVAVRVLQELGLGHLPVAGIAKSRLKQAMRAGADGSERVRWRTEERIFLPGRKNPVTFPSNSPALFALVRLRDEAHRFGITFHRKLRQKANRRSLLEEIPGIGAKRKQILLRHFGSLSALRHASLEEISAVAGVGSVAGATVFEFLQSAAEAMPREAPDVEREALDELFRGRGEIADDTHNAEPSRAEGGDEAVSAEELAEDS